MDRRARPRAFRFGVLALAGALGAVLPSAADGRGRARPDDRPNVLLIVIDTLRRDHVGAYGYTARRTTPHLDALALESLRFDRAYSSAPWTAPSIATVLTSQYPAALGMKAHRFALPTGFPPLSETLRRQGYTTGAVISHRLCSSRWHFDQGFSSFDESNISGHGGVTSEKVTDRAIDFLSRDHEGPFFLWVHYFDPHYAYIEHPGFVFPRDGTYDGSIRSGHKFNWIRKMDITDADAAELLRIYDSEVAYTDAQVGRLLDHLRSTERYENTVIVLMADHGEEFLDHGDVGHSKTLYDELVQVPLLMRIPGEPPAVVADEVGTIDVYPTVLDVLDIEPIRSLAGTSLLGREPGKNRPAFFETALEDPIWGVQYGRWKYIRHSQGDHRELYDTIRDPAERTNRLAEEPGVAEELSRLLEEWRADASASGDTPVELDLTKEERERLRSLGYVD